MLKMISVSLVLMLEFNKLIYGIAIPPGRKTANISRYPYLGIVWLVRASEFPMICTSVLVTYKCAITAGQCLVVNTPTKNYSLISLQEYSAYISMGVSTYTNTKNPMYQQSKAVKLVLHHRVRFDEPSSDPFPIRYDLGAVIVDPKLRSSPTVGTVRLIPENLNPGDVFKQTALNKISCMTVGWRATAVTRKITKYITVLRYFPKGLEMERSKSDHSFLLPYCFSSVARGPEELLQNNVTIVDVLECCNDFYNFHGEKKYQYCLNTLNNDAGLTCIQQKSHRDGVVDFEDTSAPVICPVKGEPYIFGTVTYGWTFPPHGNAPGAFRPLIVTERVLRAYVELLNKTEGGRGSAVNSDRILLLLSFFKLLVMK